jgi:sugar phosphate isomerase/epimerase
MKIEIAKAIVETAEELGIEINLYENYSGRGMFGRTTAGIVYDKDGDLLQAVAKAAKVYTEITDEARENGIELAFDVDDFIHGLKNLSSDSMGRSTIIY